MSHSGVATAITADGVDLTRSDGKIIFRITRGLDEVPEVRGTDTIVPSLQGRIPRDRRLDRLIIEAEGMVMGTGADESAQRADFVSSMEAIRDVMNPVQDPYVLSITREDGTTRTIMARPQNIVWEDDFIPTYREGTLQWESVDGADWGVSAS